MIVSLISSAGASVSCGAAVPLLSPPYSSSCTHRSGLRSITLGALVIGLGLLVDDAIISIEMMVVKAREGSNGRKLPPTPESHGSSMLSGHGYDHRIHPVGFPARRRGIRRQSSGSWLARDRVLLVASSHTVLVSSYSRLAPVRAPRRNYSTPRYKRCEDSFLAVEHRFKVAMVVAVLLLAGLGMAFVKASVLPDPIGEC